MKEYPILFSGEMVRAILDGRKTMTRRVVRGSLWIAPDGSRKCIDLRGIHPLLDACPYGKPGDLLWVRETLRLGGDNVWRYSADDGIVYCGEEGIAWAHHKDGEHCPSIHMPRWASRITLKVTGVRVEMLQDIRDADALSEGIQLTGSIDVTGITTGQPVRDFARMWDSINGKRASWGSNPWVWVVSFERVTDNTTNG